MLIRYALDKERVCDCCGSHKVTQEDYENFTIHPSGKFVKATDVFNCIVDMCDNIFKENESDEEQSFRILKNDIIRVVAVQFMEELKNDRI